MTFKGSYLEKHDTDKKSRSAILQHFGEQHIIVAVPLSRLTLEKNLQLHEPVGLGSGPNQGRHVYLFVLGGLKIEFILRSRYAMSRMRPELRSRDFLLCPYRSIWEEKAGHISAGKLLSLDSIADDLQVKVQGAGSVYM
eukprot:1372244-Amorphochlora_amoeboformis.AAC.2